MLIDLIYGSPTWEMGAVVTALFVAASLLGLVVFHRFIPDEVRNKHNEFVGFNSALVGVVFAVLLAFIAVAAWESFGKAGDTVDTEAALAGDLARDAVALPDPVKSELIKHVRDYVTIVLTKEWPAMARGEEFGDEGWVPLRKFYRDLVTLKSSDPVEVAIFTEALSRLNSLYDARRSRLLAAHKHIASAVWGVLMLGAVITIVFTYLFGMQSFVLHASMTAAVAASLALVIVLIIAFDYPFRGDVQIGPGPFVAVRHNMEVNGVQFPPANR